MAKVLLDSSYLVSLALSSETYHRKTILFGAKTKHNLLIPDVVLVEAMYNIRRLGQGTYSGLKFGQLLSSQQPQFVGLTNPDFDRAITLMRQYKDAELDFVDCCITVMAERLNITQICTYDRRDFSMIPPNHVEYFELLP